MSSARDPREVPRPDEVESLPAEEDISPAKLEEQLETEPEEARNYTDDYAPADEGVEPIAVEDLEEFED